VLLTGESGTGKELFAQALHHNSTNGRKKQEFVKLNCASIPSELLESELFGHERGAYTGATNKRIGLFEHVDGGTIFLDEISEMSYALQAKLLRVIEEKKVTPIGSNTPKAVDFRLITATNKNLESHIQQKQFREDLYYRLNVVNLQIPSLRERREDIPLILKYALNELNKKYSSNNIRVNELSEEAIEFLTKQDWPGNVRELINTVESAFIFSKTRTINLQDLSLNDLKTKESALEIEEKVIGENVVEEKIDGWYKSGVLPITLRKLAELKGTFSRPQLINALKTNPGVYLEKIGSGEQRTHHIIYLTPTTIDLFFKNTTTKDYTELKENIISGEFNKIAQAPFKIYSPSEIVNHEYISHSHSFKHPPTGTYKVPAHGDSFYIVISEDTISSFMKTKSNKCDDFDLNAAADSIKSELTIHYSQFKSGIRTL
jgi:transcriptional regulator with GAF, ATPase, and Fis domain